ncbi:hypothetical protein [Tissierella praeacuta]|uniref:hypothetical protein n=1 Tax=Tissierella praeacuta TaxID=43131 RepID=UPI002899EF0E|nr:hypothetical protein [Tissierella praeacuta]
MESIGLRIKETIETSEEITSKIFIAFRDALNEAKENGVEASELMGNGNALLAVIDNYQISIPLDEVVSKLKEIMKQFSIKTIRELNDNHIKNVVNDLIIEYLSL